MLIRREYRFATWATWEPTLRAALAEFEAQTDLAPVVVLAAERTWRRIDRARPAASPKLTEYAGLEVALDDRLPTGTFSLVYADEPGPQRSR